MDPRPTHDAAPERTPSARRRLFEISLTALVYHAGAQLGFLVESFGTNTTPVWPPSGIAFGALLLCGTRVWPGIFLGAFSANLVGFGMQHGIPLLIAPAASFPIAVGNTLEGLAGVWLLRRIVGSHEPFRTQRGVLGFLVTAALMSVVASTIGSVTVCAFGLLPWREFRLNWFTWWLGDGTGVLVLTPLIHVWSGRVVGRIEARWAIEGMLNLVGMLVGCALIFGIPFSTSISTTPLTFLALPFFVWAAYRFEHRGATLAILAASFFSVWAAATGTGPFVVESRNDSLLLVQGFVSVVAATTLVLATEVYQRRLAAEAFRASQEALLQSHKIEAVGRLAGGLAHDFNNLLQIIIGHAASLRDNQRAAAGIREAAERGNALIRQLLAYSRQQVLNPQDLDLNALVRDAGELLRPLLGERTDLQVRTGDRRLTVHADRGNVERVLVNLALNGRDAMPDGGTLLLETSAVELPPGTAGNWDLAPGRYACFRVRDTGVGMDSDTLANIFDPFFTTKRMGSGTGLGLATAYGVVRQSGGHIEARSRPGEGAEFRVYLPRVEADPESLPPVDPQRPAAARAGRILLAEDNDQVREVLATILADHGYEVTEARDGQDALARWERAERDFTAVVSDVVMPRMTGIELAREIRGRDAAVKILLLSGYSETDAAALGSCAFLQKPFEPEELLARLAALLDEES